MSPLISPLTEADSAEAGALLLQTNEGKSVSLLIDSLLDGIRRWPTLQLGARDGDALMGLVSGRIDPDDPLLAWSDDTVVAARLRGAGLGGALIEAQLQAMRTLGCRRVRGLSPERHFAQVKFFERHGFRVVERTVSQGWWGISDGQPLWITERDL